ncbi:MAG: tetratricopeptide repeat protein, partial [Desulfovibrio sp.]|nr:tetratricopeptide repeat protein [Desulfovibrio sp.]
LEARKDFWSHEDLSAFNRLGLLLRRTGKWREAADAYQKAITVAPNDETLHYNLAMAYLEGNETELARASALKALGLNPDLPKKSSRVAANLAAVFMGSNDKIHAQPLVRTALELDPQNPQALELADRLEEKTGQD